MHWMSINNGALLKLSKRVPPFDCWIVVDKNLPYQQNLNTLPCAIIILDVLRNTLKYISPLIPKIVACLKCITEKNVIVITPDVVLKDMK